MQVKKLSVLLALVLVFIVGVLPATAITGGVPDGDGHPYVGLVIFDDEEGPAWRCSGALLSPTVFLTAGHCTDGAVAARVWFESKITDLKYPYGGGTSIEAAAIHTSPDYWWGPTSNPHDVGVVILATPVTGKGSATLPYEGFLDDLKKAGELRQGRQGAEFTVVGYGLTLDWPPPVFTDELQRQVAQSEYLKLLKAWLVMSQNQAPGRDDGGTCAGDSGGPAFWEEPDGTEILVGITSWGDMPCVATGFNYRVDISDTLDFICDKGGICP